MTHANEQTQAADAGPVERPVRPAWPREAEDRVNQLLVNLAGKELECQLLRERSWMLAKMLEDCAQRLEFVSGGGEHTVSHQCLKAAAAVLRPNQS